MDRATIPGGITGLREGASHSTVKGTVQGNTIKEQAGATTYIGLFTNGPRKNLPLLHKHANNRGTDKPAHPHSLISTFAIRLC